MILSARSSSRHLKTAIPVFYCIATALSTVSIGSSGNSGVSVFGNEHRGRGCSLFSIGRRFARVEVASSNPDSRSVNSTRRRRLIAGHFLTVRPQVWSGDCGSRTPRIFHPYSIFLQNVTIALRNGLRSLFSAGFTFETRMLPFDVRLSYSKGDA